MKWDTVKQTVARNVFSSIQCSYDPRMLANVLIDLIASDFEAAKGAVCHEITARYADKAYQVIMNWDVRCVGRLRELFPDYFPPSLRTGDLVAFMADNEKQDWLVEVKCPQN